MFRALSLVLGIGPDDIHILEPVECGTVDSGGYFLGEGCFCFTLFLGLVFGFWFFGFGLVLFVCLFLVLVFFSGKPLNKAASASKAVYVRLGRGLLASHMRDNLQCSIHCNGACHLQLRICPLVFK